jgi:hypothetical protein
VTSAIHQPTREQARESLARFNAAPVFLDAYVYKRLPLRLDTYFRPPEPFFRPPDAPSEYLEGRLIPILDDGNFGIITFYNPANGVLVQKDVEAPREVLATFSNWQQYLADLMIRAAESSEDDERLRQISELIEFRYFDALMAFFNAHEHEAHYEYQRHKAEFIAGIA